jgi:predicted ATP-binding protein involved in virulence
MLKRPDQKVLNALAALESNSSFEDVRKWMEESLQDLYVQTTETKDETLSRWSAGAAQAAREFIRYSKEASSILQKFR